MRDQAAKLRMRMLQNQGGIARSIAVVSGKGGVGKSNFSTNFAALLAKEGKKVVVFDMDIGMGNIHILLGKTVPFSLKDFLFGGKELHEIMFDGPNGLQYISGGSGMTSLIEWTDTMFERLILAFETLQTQFDYILFDMGAGASNWSLDLLISIDDIIVISTAEPTAIMDAYSMMKFIHLKDEEKTFYVLCNRVFTREEGEETTDRLKKAMERFLSKNIITLGSLPEDPIVRKAVREQVPFSILAPDAPISKTMNQIVQKFIYQTNGEIHAPDATNKLLSKLKSIFSKGRV